MYRIKNILQKLTALVLLPVLCSQPALQVSAASNGYSYLLMPTQITKINNTYYIVSLQRASRLECHDQKVEGASCLMQ